MLHLVGFVDECIYIYSNYLHVTLVYNLKTNLYINKDMFYKWLAKIGVGNTGCHTINKQISSTNNSISHNSANRKTSKYVLIL